MLLAYRVQFFGRGGCCGACWVSRLGRFLGVGNETLKCVWACGCVLTCVDLPYNIIYIYVCVLYILIYIYIRLYTCVATSRDP